MPLKLILIRHAKSAWDDPDADDHARVLNPRGRLSATAIGEWLAARDHVPGQVLSSDSARTVETVLRILPPLPGEPEVRFLRKLYHAGPEAMLEAVRGAAPGRDTLALVAHNPGCAAFAEAICAAPPAHPAFGAYPTAATLVVELPAPGWAEVGWGQGRVLDFTVPRDLLD